MRTLLFLASLAPYCALFAQADGADPAAIDHIRAEYLALQNATTDLDIIELDDGTEIGRLNGDIRRIVRTKDSGVSDAYYFTSVGNPLFLFTQSPTVEARIYFDPQLNDGPGRLRMIRWVEGKTTHLNTEPAFASTEERALTDAFELLHRAQGELEYTAEVYEAIRKRIATTDRVIAERQLIATDTTNQLDTSEEEAQFVTNEPENSCWDFVITFRTEPKGKKLRTVVKQGCDAGCMAYSTYEVRTDYDENGNKICEASIINEYLFENSGKEGVVNQGVTAISTTYYDNNQPVYELLTSTHQGFEVFRRLTLMGD